jgi:ribosome-binding protein aMBF1 (putative translation factor)
MPHTDHKTTNNGRSGDTSMSRPPLETPRPALNELRGAMGRRPSSGGEHFGRLVAARRAELGLSQDELATKMNASRSIVTRIERGYPPSTEVLDRLTEALKMEPEAGALRGSIAKATAGATAGGGALRGSIAKATAGATADAGALRGSIAKATAGATAGGGALRGSIAKATAGATADAGALRGSIAKATAGAAAGAKAGGKRAGTLWTSFDGRRRWLVVGIAVLIPLLLIVGGVLSGDDGAAPSKQAPVAVTASAAPGVLSAVEQAQRQAEKEQAQAEKRAERKAAAAEREREEAAASPPPSSDSSEDFSEPVTVTPSAPAPAPAPSSGGGSSGGGSNAPPPEASHGLGGAGG